MRITLIMLGCTLVAAVPLSAQAMGGAAGAGAGAPSISMAKPPMLNSTKVRYYPQARLDAEAKVSLKFIVGTDGHPEANSIEVTKVSDSAFVEAARMTVMAQEWRPANDRGKTMRANATSEIRFKPGKMSCDVVLNPASGAICVDSLKKS